MVNEHFMTPLTTTKRKGKKIPSTMSALLGRRRQEKKREKKKFYKPTPFSFPLRTTSAKEQSGEMEKKRATPITGHSSAGKGPQEKKGGEKNFLSRKAQKETGAIDLSLQSEPEKGGRGKRWRRRWQGGFKGGEER